MFSIGDTAGVRRGPAAGRLYQIETGVNPRYQYGGEMGVGAPPGPKVVVAAHKFFERRILWRRSEGEVAIPTTSGMLVA
jgi:hypothetical protein